MRHAGQLHGEGGLYATKQIENIEGLNRFSPSSLLSSPSPPQWNSSRSWLHLHRAFTVPYSFHPC
jgi:hypothetical protein